MRQIGVGLIFFTILGAYVVIRTSPYTFIASTQFAAVTAGDISAPSTGSGSLSSISVPVACGSPQTEPADLMCPMESNTATYACDVSQGQTTTDPKKKCLKNLPCSEQAGQTQDRVVGTCRCSHICKLTKIQVVCSDPTKCTPSANPSTAAPQTRPPGAAPSPAPTAPMPTPTPTNSASPAPSTGSALSAGTPGVGSSITPVPSTGGQLSPAQPATSPSASAIDSAINNMPGSGGASIAPSTGSGLKPTVPFSGNPAIYQPSPSVPGPTPPTPATSPLSGGTNPTIPREPQSTFGGTPNSPSKPSGGLFSPVSSFVSTINPIPLVASFTNLLASFVGSASSPSNDAVIVVQQKAPVRVPIVERPYGIAPTSNATTTARSSPVPDVVPRAPQTPQVAWNINVATVPTSVSSVAQITSLLDRGLFVDVSTPSEASLAQRVSNVRQRLASLPIEYVSPTGEVIGHLPPTTSPNDVSNANSYSPQLPTIPAAAYGTSTGVTSFASNDFSVADIGTASDVATPWSLFMHSLNANLPGEGSESSSLVGKQAALAQVQSNYDGARAQIDNLQQAEKDGLCDDPCRHSLDLLLIQLPLQRAAVNALNKAIDEEIAHITQQSFTLAMPIVGFQESRIPPVEPPELSDNLPPDLSGMTLNSNIAMNVFANGGGAENNNSDSVVVSEVTAVSHDPFAKPILVLDDPWLFAPPATGSAVIGGTDEGSGFQSIAGQSDIVTYAYGVWQKLNAWLADAFSERKQSCSLFFSLFGMCPKD